MIPLLFSFLIIWTMPFYVTTDNGYQEWELQVVDKICNSIECVAGLTSAYPIATLQITEEFVFDNVSIDEYGCTLFMHEMWHVYHGDWDHSEMGWCYGSYP